MPVWPTVLLALRISRPKSLGAKSCACCTPTSSFSLYSRSLGWYFSSFQPAIWCSSEVPFIIVHEGNSLLIFYRPYLLNVSSSPWIWQSWQYSSCDRNFRIEILSCVSEETVHKSACTIVQLSGTVSILKLLVLESLKWCWHRKMFFLLWLFLQYRSWSLTNSDLRMQWLVISYVKLALNEKRETNIVIFCSASWKKMYMLDTFLGDLATKLLLATEPDNLMWIWRYMLGICTCDVQQNLKVVEVQPVRRGIVMWRFLKHDFPLDVNLFKLMLKRGHIGAWDVPWSRVSVWLKLRFRRKQSIPFGSPASIASLASSARSANLELTLFA